MQTKIIMNSVANAINPLKGKSLFIIDSALTIYTNEPLINTSAANVAMIGKIIHTLKWFTIQNTF
jgi:hypothetical protein